VIARQRRAVGVAAIFAALGGLGAGSATLARAEASRAPRVEITVIEATRTDGGSAIDPRLREVSELAGRQPFARYNSYRLLDRRELPLATDHPAIDPLLNGRTLQVALLDASGQGADRRFHVRASIGEPGKAPFLRLLEVTASADEPFFVAGQSFDRGTLFLEIVVRD
jgi:hypothetical protein